MTELLVLKKDGHFRNVYEKGRKTFARFVVIYFLKNDSGEVRVGFVAGKKIGGAVVRNRVRRRLKNIIRNMKSMLLLSGGMDMVIVARKEITDATYQEIEQELSKTVKELLGVR